MFLSAKQLYFLLIVLLLQSMLVCMLAYADDRSSIRPYRVDSQIVSLARDQIRAGHHRRFLEQQRESAFVSPPNSFIFDYPETNTTGEIKQIFWNEPEALFAIINMGKKQNILPGHLLHYFKSPSNSGGSMVVLQTFENHSYAMILQAHLVPAVNDQVQ